MRALILALCFVGTSQCMHVRQMVVRNIIKRWTALNGVSRFILPTASKDQKRRIIELYVQLGHDAHRCNLPDISENCDEKAQAICEDISDDE